jgi:hypothetical protein
MRYRHDMEYAAGEPITDPPPNSAIFHRPLFSLCFANQAQSHIDRMHLDVYK